MKIGVLRCISARTSVGEGECARETKPKHECHDHSLCHCRVHRRHHHGREHRQRNVREDVNELQANLGGILIDTGVAAGRSQHPARRCALKSNHKDCCDAPRDGDT